VVNNLAVFDADQAVKQRGRRDGPTPLPVQIWGTMMSHGIQTHVTSAFSFFRALNPQAGQTWVDIGSGYGRMGHLIGLLFEDVRFIGYEIAPERVRVSQDTAAKLKLKHVEFREQDLMDRAFSPEDADVYYLFDPVTDEVRAKVIADLAAKARAGKRFKIAAVSGWSNKILNDFAEQDWLVELQQVPTDGYQGRIFETR